MKSYLNHCNYYSITTFTIEINLTNYKTEYLGVELITPPTYNPKINRSINHEWLGNILLV